jgi:hypothetical protein
MEKMKVKLFHAKAQSMSLVFFIYSPHLDFVEAPLSSPKRGESLLANGGELELIPPINKPTAFSQF